MSHLHEITFGKHLPFFASVAMLHMSINVSSRAVTLKDELCQDLVRVLQGCITGCVACVLSSAQVSSGVSERCLSLCFAG